MTTIKEGWDRFSAVLPRHLNESQRKPFKRAFYAGAAVMWAAIVRTQGYESEEGVLFAVDQLKQECEAFANTVIEHD